MNSTSFGSGLRRDSESPDLHLPGIDDEDGDVLTGEDIFGDDDIDDDDDEGGEVCRLDKF